MAKSKKASRPTEPIAPASTGKWGRAIFPCMASGTLKPGDSALITNSKGETTPQTVRFVLNTGTAASGEHAGETWTLFIPVPVPKDPPVKVIPATRQPDLVLPAASPDLSSIIAAAVAQAVKAAMAK